MNLKIDLMEDAIQATTELGLKEFAGVWIKFLQSGWVIKESSQCGCGGKWAWFKPSFCGGLVFFGCACHNPLTEEILLNSKKTSDSRIVKLLKRYKPSADDVGKIFYTFFGTDSGAIISQADLKKIDVIKIGWWKEVTDFDVV